MVDSIDQARQQAQAARQLLEQRKREAQEAERRLQEQERNLPETRSQEALRQPIGGSALQARNIRRQVAQARDIIGSQRAKIEQFKQGLQQYEGGISVAESSIKSYEDYQTGYKAGLDMKPRSSLDNSAQKKGYEAGRRALLNYAEQKKYSDILKELQAQGATPIIENGQIVGFEGLTLPQTLPAVSLKSQIIGTPKFQGPTLPGQSEIYFRETAGYKPLIQGPVQPGMSEAYFREFGAQRPISEVEVPQIKVLEAGPDLRTSLDKRIGELQTKELRGNLGIKERAELTQLSFRRNLRNQAQNIRNLPGAVWELVNNPGQARNIPGVLSQQAIQFGRTLRESPATSVGSVGGEVAVGLGTGFVVGKAGQAVGKLLPASYETRFISQELGGAGEDIFFKGTATTTRSNIFGQRTFISGNVAQTTLDSADDASLFFKSASKTASREVVFDPVTGKYVYRKPFGSVSAEFGKATPKELNLNLGSGVKKNIEEGFELASVGKTRTLKSPQLTYFRSLGYGGNVNEGVDFFLGKSAKITKTGKLAKSAPEYSLGLFGKQTAMDDISVFIGGSEKTAQQAKKISQAVAKTNIQRNIESQLAASTQKAIRTISKGPVASANINAQLLQPIAQPSIWAGTGMYERTQETTATSIPKNVQIDFLSSNNVQSSIQKQRPVQDIMQSILNISKEKSKTKQTPIIKQSSQNINSLALGLALVPGLSSRQTQTQSQLQRQRQRQAQRTNTRQKFLPGVGFVPILKNAYSTKGGKVVQVDKDRFIIFSRRYGEDIIIGEATTLSEAKKILNNYLRRTLGASGFITDSGGAKQDVSSLFGETFRPSKRDPFRVVQRRSKRLSSSSEIFGIQSARRNANIFVLTNNKRRATRKPKRSSKKGRRQVNWLG